MTRVIPLRWTRIRLGLPWSARPSRRISRRSRISARQSHQALRGAHEGGPTGADQPEGPADPKHPHVSGGRTTEHGQHERGGQTLNIEAAAAFRCRASTTAHGERRSERHRPRRGPAGDHQTSAGAWQSTMVLTHAQRVVRQRSGGFMGGGSAPPYDPRLSGNILARPRQRARGGMASASVGWRAHLISRRHATACAAISGRPERHRASLAAGTAGLHALRTCATPV